LADVRSERLLEMAVFTTYLYVHLI